VLLCLAAAAPKVYAGLHPGAANSTVVCPSGDHDVQVGEATAVPVSLTCSWVPPARVWVGGSLRGRQQPREHWLKDRTQVSCVDEGIVQLLKLVGLCFGQVGALQHGTRVVVGWCRVPW
jgi:hypothetical protein